MESIIWTNSIYPLDRLDDWISYLQENPARRSLGKQGIYPSYVDSYNIRSVFIPDSPIFVLRK